jgi:cytochrome c biogenesis protein CcdA
MVPVLIELLVAAVLIGTMLGAFLVGGRMGRVTDEDRQHLGVIQGATLGLLGLLVGFCFSGAMNRFLERQDLIVRESNAIGTAWLRADVLANEHRDQLRLLLREYAQARLNLSESASREEAAAAQVKLAALQKRMWAVAVQGVNERPGLVVAVLPPLNEVFDLLSTRNAAARRHIPVFALGLVLTSVLMGSLLLGYGQSHQRAAIRLAAAVVVVLMAGIVWATVDLDFPQRGLIQLDPEPLRAVLRDMAG